MVPSKTIKAAYFAGRVHSILSAAESLYPGYFALVMATGIVAIACNDQTIPFVPFTLAAINWVAYGLLWGLTLVRLFRFPSALLRDLSSGSRGPGFFTIAAATSVLGAQAFTVEHAQEAAIILSYLAVALWLLISYGVFIAVTINRQKPSQATGINGAWLLAAVATQSIVVLRGDLGAAAIPSSGMQFFCLALFLAGCMLYLLIISLIIYRLISFVLLPEDFDPLYWISMGAAAITALAGAVLVRDASTWSILQGYGPFLKGFTVFFWAIAAWWIPYLVALSVWRYFVYKDPLRYEPPLWGMVFPLGMYSAATFELSRADQLPFLSLISRVFAFIALAAWVFTVCGLGMQLWRFAFQAKGAGSR